MRRRRRPRRAKHTRPKRGAPGAPPGTLARRPDDQATHIVVHRFGSGTYEEAPLETVDALASSRSPGHVVWVDVTGLADTDAIAAIGRVFGLHYLALEDALEPTQRGKVEHYDRFAFVVLETLSMAEHVQAHRLSAFVGDGFVVTLQNVDNPALHPVRDRLRQARGKIRDRGADYLAYALIDSVIDHYFPVVEAFDDHLESVEDAVLEARGINPIDLARSARQDLQAIRHAAWPTRDIVTTLLREDVTWVTDETRIHLRDCYDHIVQLQEMIEASREISASLLEAYISRVSQRTNEVMKVLTIIATIFIPLTFITGVYGMNFNSRSSPFNMPELDWYWGYPFSLLVMVGVVVGSLIFFRRKGWFGDDNEQSPPSAERERDDGSR